MKRADKENVILMITTLLMIFMPLLMDWIGDIWFIVAECSITLILLLWYSYGPITPKNINNKTHND